mgnify:CR=1 FL=1
MEQDGPESADLYEAGLAVGLVVSAQEPASRRQVFSGRGAVNATNRTVQIGFAVTLPSVWAWRSPHQVEVVIPPSSDVAQELQSTRHRLPLPLWHVARASCTGFLPWLPKKGCTVVDDMASRTALFLDVTSSQNFLVLYPHS